MTTGAHPFIDGFRALFSIIYFLSEKTKSCPGPSMLMALGIYICYRKQSVQEASQVCDVVGKAPCLSISWPGAVWQQETDAWSQPSPTLHSGKKF